MTSEKSTTKISLDWSQLLGFDQADRPDDQAHQAQASKLGDKVGNKRRMSKVGGKVGGKLITGTGLRAPY